MVNLIQTKASFIVGLLGGVTLRISLGVAIASQGAAFAGSQAIAAMGAPSWSSALSKMALRRNHATVSLDAVEISGKPTVVAALKARRAFRITRADSVVLQGWAFDPSTGKPAAAVLLRFGPRSVRAAYGLIRQDVASAFKSPTLAPVGFSARISGSFLRPGANAVSIVVISNDRKSYYVNPSFLVLDLRL